MAGIVRFLLWIVIIGIVIAGLVAWLAPSTFSAVVDSSTRDGRVLSWIKHPGDHPEWAIQAGQRCGTAPFQMPTSGFIGYLWGDSFQPGHRHQGIDIFAGTDVGVTPVYAAMDGYLTRMVDWKSSVIIRVSDDPLQPDRQIWTYYTHMANPDGDSFISADFPPGTQEMFVTAGTLLGYQGNFSGTPGQPVGVHLHFSVVRDNGQGQFLNELDINNTLDPSPYLGLSLNANTNTDEIPICKGE
jgi:peptidoglycan LD-endopeptidase LytH